MQIHPAHTLHFYSTRSLSSSSSYDLQSTVIGESRLDSVCLPLFSWCRDASSNVRVVVCYDRPMFVFASSSLSVLFGVAFPYRAPSRWSCLLHTVYSYPIGCYCSVPALCLLLFCQSTLGLIYTPILFLPNPHPPAALYRSYKRPHRFLSPLSS